MTEFRRKSASLLINRGFYDLFQIPHVDTFLFLVLHFVAERSTKASIICGCLTNIASRGVFMKVDDIGASVRDN